MLKFIYNNVVYPRMAIETEISGAVHVEFEVEKDGRINNVKVANNIGGGCAKKAVRMKKLMPKWSPGKQREKPVRVSFRVPMKFYLQG